MENLRKIFLLGFLAVFLTVHASADSIDLSSGEIESVDVFNDQKTDRWVGVVGNVYLGDRSLSRNRGDILFTDSDTGSVVDKRVRGIPGGGYFFAMSPFTDSFNSSRLKPLDNLSVLDREGLFSKKEFPTFYPDYSDYFDAPNKTFESLGHVEIAGRNLSAAVATLNDNISYYLVKYNHSSKGLQPFFIAPIEGKERGSRYDSCYDGSKCSYEMILPKVNQSSSGNSYSYFLLSQKPSVGKCGEVPGNGTSYVRASLNGTLNTSKFGDSCLQLQNDSSFLHYANSRLKVDNSSTGACSLSINGSEDSTVLQPVAENFETGICVYNSSGLNFVNGTFTDNSMGIDFNVSEGELNFTEFSGNKWSIRSFNESNVTVNEIYLEGDPSTGTIHDVKLKPARTNYSVETDFVSLDLDANLTKMRSGGFAKNFGFHYPPINRSKKEPNTIYELENSGSGLSVDKREFVIANPETTKRLIYVEGKITDFSIFTVYGTKIEPEKKIVTETVKQDVPSTSGQENPEQVQEGGSGRALPPRREPVDINLTAQDNLTVRKNSPSSLNFTVRNVGGSASPNMTVKINLDSNWRTTSSDIRSLSAGESRTGELLVAASGQVPTGNMTATVVAQDGSNVFDYDTVRIEVLPVKESSNLRIIEAPSFLQLKRSEKLDVGVLVRNTGDFKLENITARFRNVDECINSSSRKFSIRPSERRSIELDVRTGAKESECQGYIEFRGGSGQVIQFSPLSIGVGKAPGDRIPLVLPIITLIWTIITVTVFLNE